MTVGQMMSSMTTSEFLLWQYYFKVDGEKWEERKNGAQQKPPKMPSPDDEEEETFIGIDEEPELAEAKEQGIKSFLSRKTGIVQKRIYK